VDEAKINLRTTNTANSNLTRDLLTALQGLLGAKNNLISNWVDYKVSKIQLFTDLELLYLDEQGQWMNEAQGLEAVAQFGRTAGSNGNGSEPPREEIDLPPPDNSPENN
jgi:hypothetical protein